MVRHEDWPQRLTKIISECRNKPFVWGDHDCCLFAANVVSELTGVDPAADLRGTYSTAQEAAKILKKRGGVRGIATAALGHEINWRLAQRGDIVMVRTQSHGDTLSVCVGLQCLAPGLAGLCGVCLEDAITAWRVI